MYFDVRGHKTYAATGGKDFDPSLPTVMFVHGSGLDHRSWALQTRWFAYNGYSVLAPDLPGHSLSQGEALQSIEDMGAWLAEFIRASGASKVHAVGHSQGFLEVLELARLAPELLKSITGVGTAGAIPVNPALIEAAAASAGAAAEMLLMWGFGPDAQYGISAVPGMQPIAIGRPRRVRRLPERQRCGEDDRRPGAADPGAQGQADPSEGRHGLCRGTRRARHRHRALRSHAADRGTAANPAKTARAHRLARKPGIEDIHDYQ
jgi:pimeloyl-ACP methyl ester carboxylesterase